MKNIKTNINKNKITIFFYGLLLSVFAIKPLLIPQLFWVGGFIWLPAALIPIIFFSQANKLWIKFLSSILPFILIPLYLWFITTHNNYTAFMVGSINIGIITGLSVIAIVLTMKFILLKYKSHGLETHNV